jgi:glucose/arabinose dehydrogenase
VDFQSIHEEVIMNMGRKNKTDRMNGVVALALSLIILFFVENQVDAGSLPLDTITLPPGFAITIYADNVPNARGMALGQNGILFVGSKEKGNVYAVIDKNGDQRADEVMTIASGLNMPVGVAYRNGSLFVSAVDRILRFDKIEQRLANPPTPVTIKSAFPNETHHGWKFIAFGPDGKLYVPVGAPCNICEPDPDRYALIARVNQDGSGYEVVARGVRNSVGFDWDPTTHDLWFTDNGRDYFGDNQPPDELNHASKEGLHFGYPYCHGEMIQDPEYGGKHDCREFTAPAVMLGPHVAALGMRFYTGTMFPLKYRQQIFIAEHGSWNRSEKIGYRITLVSRDEQKRLRYSVFAEGWLQGQKAWGRPADVLVMPDGALLVSDDSAGAIYRIHYREP